MRRSWLLSLVAVLGALLTVLVVPSSNPARAAASAGDSAFTYTGSWNAPTGEHWTKSPGATAAATVTVGSGGGTVTFTGINWSASGYQTLQVDSATPVIADAYANVPCCSARDWLTTPVLPAGTHTFKFTVRGEHNPASTDNSLSITGIRTSNGSIVMPSAPPPPTGVVPTGAPGTWNLAFDDEFNGTAIDKTKWSCALSWQLNGVNTSCANVAETGGNAVLTLASNTSGAVLASGAWDGAGANAFLLMPGDFTEARVSFPGDSSGHTYNWPAWWSASGPNWPQGGETDIAEGLGDGSQAQGNLTINYHSGPNGTDQPQQFGTPAGGPWANAFHTFGMYRATDHVDVYWDGVKVKSFATNDTGVGQELLVNVGSGPWGGQIVTGAASQVKVDYVRAWHGA